MRALAVMAEKRVAALPDVPTHGGGRLPDQEADTLTGIVAPAGTPKAIVDRLQKRDREDRRAPDVKEKLTALGFVPIANTPEQFGGASRPRWRKWGKVVRGAKLKIE